MVEIIAVLTARYYFETFLKSTMTDQCNSLQSKKPWDVAGEPRTFSLIRLHAEEFAEVKKSKQKPKDFKGCMHPPLLQFPDHVHTLDVCPPAELHLNIGITNDIFFALNEKWGSNFVSRARISILIIWHKVSNSLLGRSMG